MNENIKNTTVRQDRDAMPYEVATSMLTTPGVKLTNRMRKNCLASRSRFFVPTEPAKPIGDKLQSKFAGKTWLQLHTIFNRATAKRCEAQKEYEKVKNQPVPKFKAGMEKQGEAAFEQLRKTRMNLLDLVAAKQELIIDLAEEEIAKRATGCK